MFGLVPGGRLGAMVVAVVGELDKIVIPLGVKLLLTTASHS
jgi:hypothetical protein